MSLLSVPPVLLSGLDGSKVFSKPIYKLEFNGTDYYPNSEPIKGKATNAFVQDDHIFCIKGDRWMMFPFGSTLIVFVEGKED